MRINMIVQMTTAVAISLAVAAVAPMSAGQHEGHQMPAAAGSCDQVAQQTAQTLDALNARLESARQTNSPSRMRAAMDDLQSALGSMKAQLSGCTTAAIAAATMPGMQHGGQPSAVSPGAAPVSPAPQPPTSASEPAPSAQSQARPNTVAASSRAEITLNTQPTPLKTGANQLEVTVKGADGKPISNADVSVLFVMPAMPAMKMPEMRNEVQLKPAGNGKYTGAGQVMMAGQWNVTVTVKQDAKEIGQKKLTLAAK